MHQSLRRLIPRSHVIPKLALSGHYFSSLKTRHFHFPLSILQLSLLLLHPRQIELHIRIPSQNLPELGP